MDYLVAKRFWRALGLPEVDDEEAAFHENDVEALRLLRTISETGVPTEELLGVARVYGQSLSRVADAETRIFHEHFVEPLLREDERSQGLEERLAPLVESFLDGLAKQLDYVHRQHLVVALQQLVTDVPGGKAQRSAIGFADLAGYSSLARRADVEEVERMIERFEDIAIEFCSAPKVRLVKMLGDAVMFVSNDPAAALDAASALVRSVAEDDVLEEARAGLDIGEVVPRGGDYFGAPVNIAARVTSFARPGTVVVTDELLTSLEEGSRGSSTIGTRRLKGVGKVKLHKVGLTGTEE
jgi:adenylate cyclase